MIFSRRRHGLLSRPSGRSAGPLVWLSVLLVVTGCDDEPTDGGGGDAALDPRDRAFVEEIVQKLVDDAQWVSNFSHEAPEGGFPELGYSHTLIGVEEGARGIVVLAPDAGVGPFDPSCDSDAPEPPDPGIWEGRDRCLRLRRISERRWAADVYFTVEPRRLPGDRHPFSYDIGGGEGTITFDPNPLISWVVELRVGGASSAGASFQRNLVFDAAEGAARDLSHTASVAAHHADPDRTTDSFELVFSEIASDGDLVVTVEVQNVEPFTAAGQVRLGERAGAEIGGTALDLSFDWQ